MKTHEVKCWPAEFAAVRSGQKRHEVRRNDRDFRDGDEVLLKEWRPSAEVGVPAGYTGEQLLYTIGHVTTGPSWGLPEDLCVFTLLDQPLNLHVPSELAEAWRIEGEDGAAGIDVAIEPDGTVFLAPADSRIQGFALHPRAAASLRDLLAEKEVPHADPT